MKLALPALVLASAALASPVQAADWTLSFTGVSPVYWQDPYTPAQLTLHIVTEDVPSRSTSSNSLGIGYRIVSFSGERDGQPVTAIFDPMVDRKFFSAGIDSYIYPDTREKLSYTGIAYQTADGSVFSLYGSTLSFGGPPETSWFELTHFPSDGYSPYTVFQGELSLSSAAAVPEPHAWLLLAAGGCVIAMRRRRQPT